MTIKLKRVELTPDGQPVNEEAREMLREGEEALGFSPEVLIAIGKAMPATMNGAGLITIVLNMMANYDMLPNSGIFIIELTKALRELKDEHPDFFVEGGVNRSRGIHTSLH